MSQQDFAKLLGTSKQVISRYELGQTTPKIGTAANWCRILDINLDNMLNDSKGIYDFSEPLSEESISLSDHEQAVVAAYRAHPEMHPAVDTLLGLSPQPSSGSSIAADATSVMQQGESALSNAIPTVTNTK